MWTPAGLRMPRLRAPHRPLETTAALPSAAARLHGPGLTVQLAEATWAASTSEKVRAAILRENGVVLMLTSAINTCHTPTTRAVLHRLVRTGDIAGLGRPTPECPPPRPPPRPPASNPSEDPDRPRVGPVVPESAAQVDPRGPPAVLLGRRGRACSGCSVETPLSLMSVSGSSRGRG